MNSKELQCKLWTTGDTWMEINPYEARKFSDKRFYSIRRSNGRTLVTSKVIDRMETEIARKIIEHLHSPVKHLVNTGKVDELIKEYEKLEGERLNIDFKFSFYQAEAIRKAAKTNLMVLTGGPGTGKTCVVKGIVYVLEHIMDNPEILFTAPTGKASRRMEESIGRSATTVQKRMHLTTMNTPPTMIHGDVIIVDEISMLDEPTMDALVCSLCEGIKVIFVGDTDQLPSVGFGSTLRDLISSAVVPVVKLEAPQRQKAGSNIYENICTIRKGFTFLTEGDDFKIIPADDKTGQKLLVDTYLEKVKEYGVDQTVVLTPYRRKGGTCANVINDLIQKAVNSSSKSVKATIYEDIDSEAPQGSSRDVIFAIGDPVMQLKNRNEVSNGDVGKIIDVSEYGVTVDYGTCEVFYNATELSQLNLAYAMSVHKSQGSEYKCVITCALPEHADLISRNLVYTAVTRAKGICIMVCDMDVIKEGLSREAAYERTTFLSEKLEFEEARFNLLVSAFSFSDKIA